MPDPRPRGRPRAFHDTTEQNTVQSLDRALTILAAVGNGAGLTLTDLAQATGQAPATVYRALITLQGHGMVELEGDGQVWHIGPGAWRVGSNFLRRTQVAERARGPMQALMRETGETANLGIERGDQVLFLSQVETHEAIRAFFPPGTQSPMHVSGIGKALLAWAAPERVDRIVALGLPGFTHRSLTTEAALRADLAVARARGYAIDDQEKTDGMRCIAAPIFNAYGEPVAGLSISGPAFRLPMDRTAELGARVRAAADGVTRATGGTLPPRADLA
jgi:IclR family transcriptional regulator, acetate operon repressor